MISLGMAFDLERDYKYLPFMVLIAFVMLMFFLLTISRSNLNRHLKTVFFFFVSILLISTMSLIIFDDYSLLHCLFVCLAIGSSRVLLICLYEYPFFS